MQNFSPTLNDYAIRITKVQAAIADVSEARGQTHSPDFDTATILKSLTGELNYLLREIDIMTIGYRKRGNKW